jgi:hypothetical protein
LPGRLRHPTVSYRSTREGIGNHHGVNHLVPCPGQPSWVPGNHWKARCMKASAVYFPKSASVLP